MSKLGIRVAELAKSFVQHRKRPKVLATSATARTLIFTFDDAPWMGGQKLDRDGTRVRDQIFQFRLAPGQYDLVMKVVPFNDQGQQTVTGSVAGPLTLDVEKKAPVKTLKIKVTGDKPVIGIQLKNDYGHFRWISCIESMEP